jgi:eukaryotic-like serine/threonine-protein kinase
MKSAFTTTRLMVYLLLVLSVLRSSVFGQEASMFRGDPQHSGIYNAAGVPKFNRVRWKFHTNGYVFSSPAVSDGVLYAGSTDGNLYAIDVKSGAEKWKFPAGVRITSSPAVAGGLVYFESYSGSFIALNAASGQLQWKFQTGGERRFTAKHLHGGLPEAEEDPDPFDFYLSSPTVWNGHVYFGSGDGNIYALDAASGALKWKHATLDVVHASPAVANGTLYIGSWDSYFYALDAITGAEKWRFKTGDDPETHNQVGIQSSASVVDGVVYFGCRDSNLYALDAETGQQKWAFNNKGSWVIGSPAVHAGKVYFATSDTGLFYALDAKSGTPVFSLEFNHWPLFSSPAVAGDTLYIGSHEGKVTAIDLTAQKTAWVFQTEGSLQNGRMFTKPDGTPNYEAAFPGNFYDDMVVGVSKMLSVGAVLSSPVVVDNVVYFGGADGNIYALM